jgi:DNA-binding NtrC family response regulator
VDVRVLAATNRDLSEEVAAGRFREDLYHRLAVLTVRLPPLRERRSDIAALVQRFMGDRRLDISPDTLALLAEYDWPGNVRELRNVIERALALIRDETELAPHLLGLAHRSRATPGSKGDEAAFFAAKEQLITKWEHSYLEGLLARCGGNVTRAARESGIGRNYLHRLLKKHNLRGGNG